MPIHTLHKQPVAPTPLVSGLTHQAVVCHGFPPGAQFSSCCPWKHFHGARSLRGVQSLTPCSTNISVSSYLATSSTPWLPLAAPWYHWDVHPKPFPVGFASGMEPLLKQARRWSHGMLLLEESSQGGRKPAQSVQTR